VLVATRFDNWKFVWCEQRAPGNLTIWQNPFTCLRAPKFYNLRMDPNERADITSDQYGDWMTKNAYLMAYGVLYAIAGGIALGYEVVWSQAIVPFGQTGPRPPSRPCRVEPTLSRSPACGP
jgi:hypothetical protein